MNQGWINSITTALQADMPELGSAEILKVLNALQRGLGGQTLYVPEAPLVGRDGPGQEPHDPMTDVPWPAPDDRAIWAKSFELMALLDGWDGYSIDQVIKHTQYALRGTMRLNCQGADFQRAVKVFVDLPAARG